MCKVKVISEYTVVTLATNQESSSPSRRSNLEGLEGEAAESIFIFFYFFPGIPTPFSCLDPVSSAAALAGERGGWSSGSCNGTKEWLKRHRRQAGSEVVEDRRLGRMGWGIVNGLSRKAGQ